MKPKRLILGTIIIIIGLAILRFRFLPEPIKVSYGLGGLNRRYFTMKVDSVEFDSSRVDNSIVFNGLLKFDDHLDKKKSQRLLSVLLDSTNYEWGETGTADFVKTIIYYDKNNEVVGQTNFSYDGQTYTYPSTVAQSKPGHLNKIGLKKILGTIE
jgi:hypothetical protein